MKYKTKKQVENEFREKVGKSGDSNLWDGKRRPRLTGEEKQQLIKAWERQKNLNRIDARGLNKILSKPLRKLPPEQHISDNLWDD